MKIVLLYSGGLDSVGALWNLLNETTDEIFVQHISIDCDWKHWQAEKASMDASLSYINKHCREFTILPDVYYSAAGIPMYNPLCVFFGAMAVLEVGADKLYTVGIKGDNVDRIVNVWKTITGPMFKGLVDNPNITYERPFLEFTKKSWVDTVPKELLALSCSCRHPIKINNRWHECGVCVSCLETAESLKGIKPLDRKPTTVRAPLLFDHSMPGTRTMVLISKYNDGLITLYNILAETNDKVAIQIIDTGDEEYIAKLNKELNQLKLYDIKRLRDVRVNTYFDSSVDSLIVMYSFCSAFKRYEWQFDRVLTGNFDSNNSMKLDRIYKSIIVNAVWEDNAIPVIKDIDSGIVITYNELYDLTDSYVFTDEELERGFVYIRCEESLIEPVIRMCAAVKQGLVFYVIEPDNTEYMNQEILKFIDQNFVKKNDGYQIAITSGTTSSAKFIYSTVAERQQHSDFVIEKTKLNSADIVYNMRGIGNGAWINTVRHALTVEATLLLSNQTGTMKTIRLLEEEKPTVIFSTPPVLSRISRSGMLPDIETVRLWYVSGSPINTVDAIEVDKKLKNGVVVQACSRAESNVPFMSDLGDTEEKRIFTIGYSPRDDITKVVDGELYIRSEYIIPMLCDMHPFTDDGWYQTGDLVDVDSDGYYTFKGRKKLLINVGATDINPLEVEKIVDSIDGVEKSYCVGIVIDGEPQTKFPCLVIQGKNMDHLSIASIVEETMDIELYKIVEVDDFPLTHTGKIDRITLTRTIQNEGVK